MTLNDLVNNWSNVSTNLKLEALNKVIAEYLSCFHNGNDGFIKEILINASEWEQEDYFGTEGLNIGND